ncbi:glycosyl hydrolase family 61-domain-containing protein [Sphaerosporella brunnea]|uniref:AA9 family lytic polysaccharide monooxygenase n=1 Tax=Sphaerosporella brunnea TaxID=1250544 RepID=A0A5J5F0B4_9PEZI|nr:glycosyl hydrolase family 61-domain-containing protein [Sphaerosporella brunnea]
MKYTTLFTIAAVAGIGSAHSVVSHFHVNGKAESSCVRQADSTSPVIDLASEAMACNVVSTPATAKCEVKGGETVEFEWRTDRNIAPENYPLNENGERIGVTDTSHIGPCAVYAKKVSDALTGEGPGNGWFKIMEDGLDSNGVFCTTRLRKSNAYQSAKIPMSIAPGDYLLRAELLTLKNAGPKSVGGQEQPQFYSGCVQVTITGTTGTVTPETVSIPGYVNTDTPGLTFDVRNSPTGTFSGYSVPGPALFSDAATPEFELLKRANTTIPTNTSKTTSDYSRFPDQTVFPGASTAVLLPSLQKFSTADPILVTFTTTAFYNGSVPETKKVLKTFPGSLWHPSAYPTAVSNSTKTTYAAYAAYAVSSGSNPTKTTYAVSSGSNSTKTTYAVFPTFTDYPNKPAIPGTVIREDLTWTHSNFYPTWDAAASTWIYPSTTATPPATTTSADKEVYTTAPSNGTYTTGQSSPSNSTTKTTYAVFPTFTDYPNKPAIPGTVIREDLTWTHSNFYPTWDAAASTWIYPSTTATPPATTTSADKEVYTTAPSNGTYTIGQPSPSSSTTKTTYAVFPTFTDYPNKPAIPGTVIREDLTWTHSNFYPTWDAAASTWIYPSTTATPPAATAEEVYPTTLYTTIKKGGYPSKAEVSSKATYAVPKSTKSPAYPNPSKSSDTVLEATTNSIVKPSYPTATSRTLVTSTKIITSGTTTTTMPAPATRHAHAYKYHGLHKGWHKAASKKWRSSKSRKDKGKGSKSKKGDEKGSKSEKGDEKGSKPEKGSGSSGHY